MSYPSCLSDKNKRKTETQNYSQIVLNSPKPIYAMIMMLSTNMDKINISLRCVFNYKPPSSCNPIITMNYNESIIF